MEAVKFQRKRMKLYGSLLLGKKKESRPFGPELSLALAPLLKAHTHTAGLITQACWYGCTKYHTAYLPTCRADMSHVNDERPG